MPNDKTAAQALPTFSHPILIFDGVCNMCNSTISFVIDRDTERKFRYTENQNETGKTILEAFNKQANDVNTFYLYVDGKLFDRSAAVIAVAKMLPAPWKLIAAAVIVPSFLRNAAYDVVARNRYKWFGKKDSCRIPTQQERDLFI